MKKFSDLGGGVWEVFENQPNIWEGGVFWKTKEKNIWTPKSESRARKNFAPRPATWPFSV
jgi:hypothetical protein